MAVNDLYQLKLSGSLFGQDTMNVFYYRQVAGAGDAQDLAAAFGASVLPQLVDIACIDMTYLNTVTINYDDLGDFHTDNFVAAGIRPQPSAPPFVCWGFMLERASRELRNGSKRFAGVSEQNVTDGIADPAILAELGDVADAIGNAISDGGNTFAPRIVRLDKVAPYLPIADIGITGAIYKRVTTQNTRKYGVGT